MVTKTVNKHASEFSSKARKTILTALVGTYYNDSHVELVCSEKNGDPEEYFTMRLPYKAWDDKTRQYVSSDEAQSRCDDNLASIGLNFKDIDMQLPVEFEGWVKDQTATLWEPSSFVRTASVKDNLKYIREALKKNAKFVTLPFTEMNGVRFDCPILIEIDGELTPFRVSQLIVEGAAEDGTDQVVKLKYERGSAVNIKKAIDETVDDIDEKVLEARTNALQAMLNQYRNGVLKEFKQYVGHDLEEMIENEESLEVKVEIRTVSTTPYLVGVISQ